MPLREIKTSSDLNSQRSGEDRVLAKKINFELHLLTKKARDVDVVPRLFVIAARAVVANVYNVILDVISEYVFKNAALGLDL